MGLARNDTVRLIENRPFTIDYLANDTLEEGDRVEITPLDWMSFDSERRLIGTVPFEALAQDEQTGTVIYYSLVDRENRSNRADPHHARRAQRCAGACGAIAAVCR